MAVLIRNVLISDPVDEACAQLLREHGLNVTCRYKMAPEELLQEVKRHDALVVRSETRVTAEVLAAGALRVVGRAGAGVDNIDVEAATRKGVIVLNTPGGNSISACELTCSLITTLARNVPQACQSLKEGRWDRKLYTGSELAGKTLAVLGLGRIGREVAVRMQAFGMRTIGFDPIVTKDAAATFGVEKMELEQIWPVADYITVHTPLIPQTRNLICDASLNKCKRGVRIVNVARGGIVDEEALLGALEDGRCGGAALDVFCEEPPRSEGAWALVRHPRVVATPHLGASTAEAQRRVAVEVAEQLAALATGAPFALSGVLNAPALQATVRRDSAPWVRLATELGRVSARLLQGALPGTAIEITATECNDENVQFLGTAVLVGMLSGHTKNGLNMVNAPALAHEAGISVVVRHESTGNSTRSLRVAVSNNTAGTHTVEGTVRAEGEPLLLRVDGAVFEGGVALGPGLALFQATSAHAHLGGVVTAMLAQGAPVASAAVATSDKASWFALRIAGDQPTPSIDLPGIFTVL